MSETDKIIAYKGFGPDWKCRDFQYAVGGTYKLDEDVRCCEIGFHACTNPLDVLVYYDLFDSKFAVVEMSGKIDKKSDGDSKMCSAELHVKAEMKLPEFIGAAVKWGIDHCAAGVGGVNQAASVHSAKLAASGYYAKLAASGDCAQLAASGHYAKLAASGDSAQLAADGKDSVIASSGYNTVARGVAGTWVSLAEFDANGRCVGFATGCIGIDGILENVNLRAKGGKLVPVDA